MNASLVSLACLLLCACSSNAENPGTGTGGTAGYGGGAAGGAGLPGQAGTGLAPGSGGATNPPPGSGGGSFGGSQTGLGGIQGGTGAVAGGMGGSGVAGAGNSMGGTAGTPSGGAGGVAPMTGGTAGTSNGGTGGGSTDGTKGCGTTTLLAAPADPSARGPWPVGTKTVKFGRFDAVEVMYPATVGSDAGKQPVMYDLRSWLPMSEQSKIPDAEAKQVTANSFAGLPLDTTHGPYPLVILVHGTGAFRVASGLTQSQWASRGFIVVAAEHPNLYLTDYLNFGCNTPGFVAPTLDLSGDVDSELQTVKAASGDLAFLAGHVDTTHVGLVGHSAGAYNVAQFANKPNVEVIIPLSGTHAVTASSTLKSVAFIGGIADTVLGYNAATGIGQFLYPGSQVGAYMTSAGPPAVKKRIAGITGGGHLAVTDLCQTNKDGKNAIQVAQAHNVCGLGLLPSLFDCGTVARETATKIVNDMSTAVLEETLECQDRAATISAIKSRNSEIGDLQEAK